MKFEYNGFQYQITEHISGYSDVHKIRLWVLEQGEWEIGHSKHVPQGTSAVSAMWIMRSFIEEGITHAEYNTELPD